MSEPEFTYGDFEQYDYENSQSDSKSTLIKLLDACPLEKRVFDFPFKTMTAEEQTLLDDGRCVSCGLADNMHVVADNEYFTGLQCKGCKTIFMLKPAPRI